MKDNAIFYVTLLCCSFCYICHAAFEESLNIRLGSNRQSVTFNDSVDLVCEVGSSRGLPSVEWRRDSGDLFIQGSTDWATIKRALSEVKPVQEPPLYKTVLELVKMKQNHSYSCQAVVGITTVFASVTIPVGPLPSVHIDWKVQAPQPRGRNLTISCDVISDMEAEVTWLEQPGRRVIVKGAAPSIFNRTAKGQMKYTLALNLFPVGRNATYTCSAKNIYGTKGKTIVVDTETYPLGCRCKAHLDCGPKDSVCESELCTCPFDAPIFVKDSNTCYRGVQFGSKCSFSDQCRLMDNLTECTSGKTCQCVDATVYSMDRKACIYPESEPMMEEIFAGLAAILTLIVAGDLAVYVYMKRGERKGRRKENEEDEGAPMEDGEGMTMVKLRGEMTLQGGNSSCGDESSSDWEASSKTSSFKGGRKRYVSSSHSPSLSGSGQQQVVMSADRSEGSCVYLSARASVPLKKSLSLQQGTGPKKKLKEKSVSLEIIRGRELEPRQPVIKMTSLGEIRGRELEPNHLVSRVTRGQSEKLLKPPIDHLRTHSF